MNNELNTELRRLRHLRGDSLRDVEKATGISNAYLSQLETGKIDKPSPHILHKLANHYGVSYTYLMELAGYLQPQQSTQSENTVGSLDAALMSAQLNKDEEALVAKFIQFLRSQRNPQHQ